MDKQAAEQHIRAHGSELSEACRQALAQILPRPINRRDFTGGIMELLQRFHDGRETYTFLVSNSRVPVRDRPAFMNALLELNRAWPTIFTVETGPRPDNTEIHYAPLLRVSISLASLDT